jgi:hypothetical protein
MSLALDKRSQPAVRIDGERQHAISRWDLSNDKENGFISRVDKSSGNTILPLWEEHWRPPKRTFIVLELPR